MKLVPLPQDVAVASPRRCEIGHYEIGCDDLFGRARIAVGPLEASAVHRLASLICDCRDGRAAAPAKSPPTAARRLRSANGRDGHAEMCGQLLGRFHDALTEQDQVDT